MIIYQGDSPLVGIVIFCLKMVGSGYRCFCLCPLFENQNLLLRRDGDLIMDYKKAVFELWCWQNSYSGCFHNKLFDLIHKADKFNKLKLMGGFPEECRAHRNWYESEDPNEFFKCELGDEYERLSK